MSSPRWPGGGSWTDRVLDDRAVSRTKGRLLAQSSPCLPQAKPLTAKSAATDPSSSPAVACPACAPRSAPAHTARQGGHALPSTTRCGLSGKAAVVAGGPGGGAGRKGRQQGGGARYKVQGTNPHTRALHRERPHVLMPHFAFAARRGSVPPLPSRTGGCGGHAHPPGCTMRPSVPTPGWLPLYKRCGTAPYAPVSLQRGS